MVFGGHETDIGAEHTDRFIDNIAFALLDHHFGSIVLLLFLVPGIVGISPRKGRLRSSVLIEATSCLSRQCC